MITHEVVHIAAHSVYTVRRVTHHGLRCDKAVAVGNHPTEILVVDTVRNVRSAPHIAVRAQLKIAAVHKVKADNFAVRVSRAELGEVCEHIFFRGGRAEIAGHFLYAVSKFVSDCVALRCPPSAEMRKIIIVARKIQLHAHCAREFHVRARFVVDHVVFDNDVAIVENSYTVPDVQIAGALAQQEFHRPAIVPVHRRQSVKRFRAVVYPVRNVQKICGKTAVFARANNGCSALVATCVRADLQRRNVLFEAVCKPPLRADRRIVHVRFGVPLGCGAHGCGIEIAHGFAEVDRFQISFGIDVHRIVDTAVGQFNDIACFIEINHTLLRPFCLDTDVPDLIIPQ